jgi:hypothetical protein
VKRQTRERASCTTQRDRAARRLWIALLTALVLPASSGQALIFAGPETEPSDPIPPDFPYWDHVTQRRYEGPSVIYLGGGWALTAKHVGQGEIFVKGQVIAPDPYSRHTLLNQDGSPADAMVFELDRRARIPDLPLIPIARRPAQVGEELLLIGFGRERDKIVQWTEAGPGSVGFTWTQQGTKRWGTNRVWGTGEWVVQPPLLTRTFIFRFDDLDDPDSTRFEAHAALGDSGGAVFVKRDQGWELLGMMISVTGAIVDLPRTSTVGDLTYAADLSAYREEIFRWARPVCANEIDDDGDGKIDYPRDPDCEDENDRDERGRRADLESLGWVGFAGLGIAGSWIGRWLWKRSQRGTRTPSSTSPSSAP